QSEKTGGVVSRGHVVEEATAGKLEAPARVNDDFAIGLFAGDVFDGVDGHGHGEQGAHFGFADVQRHGVSVRFFCWRVRWGTLGFYMGVDRGKNAPASKSGRCGETG